MVNGSRCTERLKRQHSISFVWRSCHLSMPDLSPSNDDSLKLQLLTARKKEW